MSAQKHTQEPWQQFEHDKRAIVSEEHPNLSLLSIDDDGLGIFFEEKDARRVVACVNACAGISTESLEKGGVGSLLELGLDEQRRGDSAEQQRDDLQRELAQVNAAMKAQADGLVKQRDELVAAMRAIALARNLGSAHIIAKDSIASVKGGAA